MDAFSPDQYHYLKYELHSADEGSPASDGGAQMMLAEMHPKKRAGRKKFRETRHPVYRGVRQRNYGKWVCEVRQPNNKSRIWLGTFPTVEMAARAHDVAAIAFRGRAACLNFADSSWRLPVPASGDAKDIKRAAHEAAEAFRPANLTTAEAEEEPTGGVSAGDREGSSEDVLFMDEEDMFRMPELFADMYKGMMLPPPPLLSDDVAYDDVEYDVDLPLWSYSI